MLEIRDDFKFQKVLAKYYEIWYRNCHESAVWLREREKKETLEIERYLAKAQMYFDFINEHWNDIEFYRYGDNAYLLPDAEARIRNNWRK